MYSANHRSCTYITSQVPYFTYHRCASSVAGTRNGDLVFAKPFCSSEKPKAKAIESIVLKAKEFTAVGA